MKKVVFFLLILTFARVGGAYGGNNSEASIQDFFLGNSANGGTNLNQVLALLVGPQGAPGVAGVAGADGFVGMNGQDGKDGLEGAPGPVGPAGATGPAGPAGPAGESVSVVPFTGTGGNCTDGGTKFIAADGTTSFACNGVGLVGPAGAAGSPGVPGAPGAAGAAGSQGVQGVPGPAGESGGGSGGGTGFGAGTLPIGTCDDAVNLNFTHQFNGREFLLTGLTIANLNGACNGQTLHVYLNIRSTGALNLTGNYIASDVIDCEFQISDLAAGDTNSRKLKDVGDNPNDLTMLLGSCSNKGLNGESAGNPIAFNQISARDLDTTFGFQIAS